MVSCEVAAALLAAALGQDDEAALRRAADPQAVVFVGDLCRGGEGAPPAARLGALVPYRAALDLIAAEKKPLAVLEVPAGDFAAARAGLHEHRPEFVLIVTRPERIDVNVHFDVLEMALAVDEDPFADFAFGYVTGATALETVDFARRFLARAKKKGGLPKTLLEFGPAANGAPTFGGPRAHAVAKGWKESFAFHGPVSGMLERKDQMRGLGILRAGGHGMPVGVDDGLKGVDLRREKLDLAPALYFSGPCYCGVTSGYFTWKNGVAGKRPRRRWSTSGSTATRSATRRRRPTTARCWRCAARARPSRATSTAAAARTRTSPSR
jgi:hypothetical protein